MLNDSNDYRNEERQEYPIAISEGALPSPPKEIFDIPESDDLTKPARGGTIQIFVFFHGEYLGYQCFSKEEVTIGSAPGNDLFLPAYDEDTCWGVSLSEGVLYIWHKPEQSNGNGRGKTFKKIEPLDSFLVGGYRLQVKQLYEYGLDRHREQFAEAHLQENFESAQEESVGLNEEMLQEADPEDTCDLEDLVDEDQQAMVDRMLAEVQKANLDISPCESSGEDMPSPDKDLSTESAPGAPDESIEDVFQTISQDDDNTNDDVITDNIFDDINNNSNTAIENDAAEKETWEEEFFSDDFPSETEEDNESEESETQYFSLLKHIFPDRKAPLSTPPQGERAVEIIRFQAGDVQDISHVEEKGGYAIRKGWSRRMCKREGGTPPNFKMIRMDKQGLAFIYLCEGMKGRIYTDQAGSKDIKGFYQKEEAGGLKAFVSWGTHKSSKVSLSDNQWALLKADRQRYLVRYVPKQAAATALPVRPRVSRSQLKLFGFSLAAHLLLILLLGFAVPQKTLEGFDREERFARVDPELLKILKPPQPVKKAMKKPKPVPPQKKVAKKTPIKRRSSTVKKKSPGGGGKAQQPGPSGPKQINVAQTGLLGALGGSNAGLAGAKGKSEVLLAAVTNLDAVAVPKGTATFNLAGIAGKLASSEVQVAAGDVIETMGATEILKAGNGLLGAMAGTGGTGEVKGIVHETPKAKVSIRGGMSREAVLKVVNAHLDEVRDCYERELLHNPGLAGKILMEWLIKKNGSVKYAKIKFTNIGHSSDIHECIRSQIVDWKFPKPTGGQEVVVTFPFMFENVGF